LDEKKTQTLLSSRMSNPQTLTLEAEVPVSSDYSPSSFWLSLHHSRL
jgi:hypothetical protein